MRAQRDVSLVVATDVMRMRVYADVDILFAKNKSKGKVRFLFFCFRVNCRSDDHTLQLDPIGALQRKMTWNQFFQCCMELSVQVNPSPYLALAWCVASHDYSNFVS